MFLARLLLYLHSKFPECARMCVMLLAEFGCMFIKDVIQVWGIFCFLESDAENGEK